MRILKSSRAIAAYSSLLLTTTVGAIALTPQPAAAYLAMDTVELQRQREDTYTTMLIRAQAVAQTAVQQQLDRDLLVTEVSILVLGKNNGNIAPLLRLRVSRRNWRSHPDPAQWATYFPNARTFLGFPAEGTPAPTPPPPNEGVSLSSE